MSTPDQKSRSPDKDKRNSRRSVACKSCHSLKVKCTPSDPNNPSGPCIRCLNSKRRCEIDLNQPRKRRRKAEILEARALAASGSKPENNHVPSHTRELSMGHNDNYAHNDNSYAHSDANYAHSDATYDNNENDMDHEMDNDLEENEYDSGNPSTKSFTPLEPSELQNSPQTSSDPNELIRHLTNQVQSLKSQLSFFQNHNSRLTDSPRYISKKDLEHELKILSRNSASDFMNLSSDLRRSAADRASLINGTNERVDILSRNIISVEEAEFRLSLYRDKIYPTFPYIDIDFNLLAPEVARQGPYLFNAIMSVSSILIPDGDQEVSHVIDIETTKHLMTQVFIAGTKNEELLKTLVLLNFWYNTPELVKQRRFHLLNALGISMLHDLGIVAKGPNTSDGKEESNNDIETAKGDSGNLINNDFTNIQQRKLVMLLYVSTVSICIILRRSIYVKWTPYVEECCKFLEETQDLKLLHLVLFSRLSHELEKIHNIIHSSENTIDNSSATKYIVREFQKKLDMIRSRITENQHGLLAFYYSIEAYLHEPMLTEVAGIDEYGQVFFKEEALRSISRCTSCCLQCLEEFAILGSETIATAPLVYTSRIIYTAGILLRLRYLILSFPLFIEKELVPPSAITEVQNTNLVFIKASKSYPFNYALKKTSLMLQLFIQTYANQVTNLLDSDDGTPNNFKSTHEDPAQKDLKSDIPYSEALDHMLARSGSATITSETGMNHKEHVPLELLSNAAAWTKDMAAKKGRNFSRSSMGSPTRKSESPSGRSGYNKLDITNSEQKYSMVASLPQLPNNNTFNINNGGPTNGTRNFSPSINSGVRFRDPGQPRIARVSVLGPSPLNSQPRFVENTNMNLPQVNNDMGPMLNKLVQDPGSLNSCSSPHLQNILNTPTNFNGSSMSHNSGVPSNSSYFGVPGFEELDKSFYNIGEEFWSDIINPDFNNFNLEGKGSASGDVFSMTT